MFLKIEPLPLANTNRYYELEDEVLFKLEDCKFGIFSVTTTKLSKFDILSRYD